MRVPDRKHIMLLVLTFAALVPFFVGSVGCSVSPYPLFRSVFEENRQANRDDISEQVEPTHLDEHWMILDRVGTISVRGGYLSLSGGVHKRINSRQEFHATAYGISAKARIKLGGDYQKFGFGVNPGEFPSPTAGFYFDTYNRFDSSEGSENTVNLLVIDMPNGRSSQNFLLKKRVPVTWNEFHDFAVVWTISKVSFYIDSELMASVPYAFDHALPVGIWNDRSQLMQIERVDVLRLRSRR